ncbi:hypothetical protein EX30DRAFT_57587 [Ascodesmis nigricans]|uniref:diphosphoinositol-polyphosphate diphosphatase n=1 Tax=Ascodesmis nigricans TaxID=341454 RepID=A0A4S2MUX9_9PEZI|nr:hypothetical protein EX30DRAFT_57587 [Ascodesmis nigricans]
MPERTVCAQQSDDSSNPPSLPLHFPATTALSIVTSSASSATSSTITTTTTTAAFTGVTANSANSSQSLKSRRHDMNTHIPHRPTLSWSSSFCCTPATRTTSDSVLSSTKRPSSDIDLASPKSTRVLSPPPLKMARTASYPTMESFTCPDNFAVVTSSVYRSSFPKPENFSYIKKLGLKTILTLVPEPYPEENVAFMKENGITHYQIGMPGNNKGNPLADPQVPDDKISVALSIIFDRANHPILIHCNKGKHRTGCVVGCLRRFQGWSVPLAIEEYRKYAGIKARSRDMAKIENYSLKQCWETAKEGGWVPTASLVQEDEEEEVETGVTLMVTAPVGIKAQ